MNALVRVFDDGGNMIEAHGHAGDFKEWQSKFCSRGLAEVKLVYDKNAKWLLSRPHQLQKFAQ